MKLGAEQSKTGRQWEGLAKDLISVECRVALMAVLMMLYEE
jgi:hypothetical protein